jgi:hypothetical protein
MCFVGVCEYGGGGFYLFLYLFIYLFTYGWYAMIYNFMYYVAKGALPITVFFNELLAVHVCGCMRRQGSRKARQLSCTCKSGGTA